MEGISRRGFESRVLVSIGEPYTANRIRQQPRPPSMISDQAPAIGAIKSTMVERKVRAGSALRNTCIRLRPRPKRDGRRPPQFRQVLGFDVALGLL